ncbi:hypothetical protein D9758_010864 [Tetrapyrgos nigripes]|uniref:DUF6593 domain-containing protein n=1 Tax=Tetrapyrgos nigripes TaxID=182062 RepID=A0A8H5LQ42_9AGAR|nr:hypothetical protein D9758_010864 [Tetrapyrgos nigripes]
MPSGLSNFLDSLDKKLIDALDPKHSSPPPRKPSPSLQSGSQLNFQSPSPPPPPQNPYPCNYSYPQGYPGSPPPSRYQYYEQPQKPNFPNPYYALSQPPPSDMHTLPSPGAGHSSSHPLIISAPNGTGRTFLVEDPSLANASISTLTPISTSEGEGFVIVPKYKTESRTSKALGDKKTTVYKLELEKNGSGTERKMKKMATIGSNALDCTPVVKVWDRELGKVKVSFLRGNVEFTAFDGCLYKWKGSVQSKGLFKQLQRQDQSQDGSVTVELGSFRTEMGRTTLRFEEGVAMPIMEQCIAALVLAMKNQNEVSEVAEVISTVAGA